MRGMKAREMLQAALAAGGWNTPKPGPNYGRGIGMFGRQIGGGAGGAMLTAELDGTLTVLSPTIDQGAGTHVIEQQLVATDMGVPLDRVRVVVGDTDTAPYGLGTYASRSTPVSGAATALAARKIKEKARKIAAYLLEASEEDLEWEPGKFWVKGAPSKSKTIQEIAFAAYTNHPQGMEAGLEAVNYYDPPNLTFPFGTYIAVVDIDKGTGAVKIRQFVAVDDCGNIINPMIVEGQIHGGLTEGMAIAFMQLIDYDENGNVQGGTFMDYLLPTAVETPNWQTGKTVTPSPHHPFRRNGSSTMRSSFRAAQVAGLVGFCPVLHHRPARARFLSYVRCCCLHLPGNRA